MKVQIRDFNGYCYSIDSFDTKVIAAWAAEHIELLMSANACFQSQLSIWPTTTEESRLIGHREVRLDPDGFMELAGICIEAEHKLIAKERARR